MTDRDGTNEPGGADELDAARDARGPGTEALDRRERERNALSNLEKQQAQDARSVTEDFE